MGDVTIGACGGVDSGDGVEVSSSLYLCQTGRFSGRRNFAVGYLLVQLSSYSILYLLSFYLPLLFILYCYFLFPISIFRYFALLFSFSVLCSSFLDFALCSLVCRHLHAQRKPPAARISCLVLNFQRALLVLSASFYAGALRQMHLIGDGVLPLGYIIDLSVYNGVEALTTLPKPHHFPQDRDDKRDVSWSIGELILSISISIFDVSGSGSVSLADNSHASRGCGADTGKALARPLDWKRSSRGRIDWQRLE
jgi:hypothetical protein